MTQKTIALITDFGNRDYFVGVLKGVIKSIIPDVDIVDISNDIPSYQIHAASFVLEKTYKYFNPRTVFLVVVDPGVGTDRKILIVPADDYIFIGPDNGVLTPILKKKSQQVRVMRKNDYFLNPERSTFDARDRMAPVAAHILRGVSLDKVSRETGKYLVNEGYFPEKKVDSLTGRVVYIDKFGNIITNVSRDFLFGYLSLSKRSRFSIHIGNRQILDFHKTYAEGGAKPFMLIGSHANLEIAMNRASASDYLKVKLNQSFSIIFH